jgi:chlorite dismutase
VAAPISATFIGTRAGSWRIERCVPVVGEGLPVASHLVVQQTLNAPSSEAAFMLRGSTGHVRYVEQAEQAALAKVTPPLARPEATRAALIPIRKKDAWWELAQDERRALLEQRSQHISVGLKYLPAIARRLYHARELGEPFDFLTWFEYAPEHANLFEELVAALRASEEWSYVEREVDLRLVREGT